MIDYIQQAFTDTSKFVTVCVQRPRVILHDNNNERGCSMPKTKYDFKVIMDSSYETHYGLTEAHIIVKAIMIDMSLSVCHCVIEQWI